MYNNICFSASDNTCYDKGCPNDDDFCYIREDDDESFAYCEHCSLIPPGEKCADLGLSAKGLTKCTEKCETGIF